MRNNGRNQNCLKIKKQANYLYKKFKLHPKIITKCIDLWVHFWYYNFEIILCLKYKKMEIINSKEKMQMETRIEKISFETLGAVHTHTHNHF